MPFQQFCSGTLITKLCCFLTTNDLPVANPKAFQCEASGSCAEMGPPPQPAPLSPSIHSFFLCPVNSSFPPRPYSLHSFFRSSAAALVGFNVRILGF